MVSMVDRHVGEVLDLLRELELESNTLVFFSGDNGGNDYFSDAQHPRGIHGANVHPQTGVEFRGKKGTLYEGGLRVPMLARWPGKIAAGRESPLLWYFPDVLPTLVELAGVKAPGDIDGLSIVPELIGETAAGRRQQQHEHLYWELNNQVAVRSGNWKAVQPGRQQPWELYDLSRDVSERHDLASQEPAMLERLKEIAAKSHVPAVEGTFFDREIHERDRRAKFGKQ
jgi:arylsulfatase A-like enzyme